MARGKSYQVQGKYEIIGEVWPADKFEGEHYYYLQQTDGKVQRRLGQMMPRHTQ